MSFINKVFGRSGPDQPEQVFVGLNAPIEPPTDVSVDASDDGLRLVTPPRVRFVPLLVALAAFAGIVLQVIVWLLLDGIMLGLAQVLDPAWPARNGVLTHVIGVIVVVVVSGMYVNGVRNAYTKRRPTERQRAIQCDPEYMLLSTRAWDHVMHTLMANKTQQAAADTVVLAAMRKHVFMPILKTIGAALLALALCIGAPWILSTTPAEVSFSAVVLGVLLVLLALGVYLGMVWTEWSSWYLIVTDKRVRIVEQWPAWLLRNGRRPALEAHKINWCETRDQSAMLSRIFRLDFGIVNVDGYTGEDAIFKDMDYIPRFTEVGNLINGIGSPHAAQP